MRALERRLIRLEAKRVRSRVTPLIVLGIYDKPAGAVTGFACGKHRVWRIPGEEIRDLLMRARRELQTRVLWAEYRGKEHVV